MEIVRVHAGDALAPALCAYARACSWDAGPGFADYLERDLYKDFECAFAALEEGRIAGFCNALKVDCIPDLPYTPYIGFLFVGEDFRGQRLSQRLLCAAEDYLRDCGFHEAFLTTDHENLYEKYGYKVLGTYLADWGEPEKLYRKEL